MSRNVWCCLSGGVNEDGTLQPHVKNRVDHLANLDFSPGDAVIFSSLFSLNVKQKINEYGYVFSEAKQMFEYHKVSSGLKVGVQYFLENASFDTVGSAFFLRQNFEFLFSNSVVQIITNEFHMQRTRRVFTKIFSLEPEIMVESLRFVSIPNPQELGVRPEKEEESLNLFVEQTNDFSDLVQFQRWLFESHLNYSTNFNSSSTIATEALY